MPRIVLTKVSKVFGSEERTALKSLNLAIEPGELLMLAGPSGAGKTTLLRIIAGLESPSSGTLLVDDSDVEDTPPHKRDVAMVFQHPALYPHLCVADNIGFGLKLRNCPAPERRNRVREMADLLGIGDLLNRRPYELSGGQAQRVALARALVRRPSILLLDEPFSNLDPLLALELRSLVLSLHRQFKATTVWSTHFRADLQKAPGRIALLRHGTVEQVGTLNELRMALDRALVSELLFQ